MIITIINNIAFQGTGEGEDGSETGGRRSRRGRRTDRTGRRRGLGGDLHGAGHPVGVLLPKVGATSVCMA